MVLTGTLQIAATGPKLKWSLWAQSVPFLSGRAAAVVQFNGATTSLYALVTLFRTNSIFIKIKLLSRVILWTFVNLNSRTFGTWWTLAFHAPEPFWALLLPHITFLPSQTKSKWFDIWWPRSSCWSANRRRCWHTWGGSCWMWSRLPDDNEVFSELACKKRFSFISSGYFFAKQSSYKLCERWSSYSLSGMPHFQLLKDRYGDRRCAGVKQGHNKCIICRSMLFWCIRIERALSLFCCSIRRGCRAGAAAEIEATIELSSTK